MRTTFRTGSKSGDLDPTGWMSIADYVAGGHSDQIADLLGSWGLGFHESSAKPRALTELSLNASGCFSRAHDSRSGSLLPQANRRTQTLSTIGC